jgi:hypothetical protein
MRGGNRNQAMNFWEIRYERAIKFSLKSRITQGKCIEMKIDESNYMQMLESVRIWIKTNS